ncbi:hypothetical protein BDN70DRAFT_997645 [Pholiota conissans]|uniref:Rhodopsin domain-containing protein n=1 Tax=Pholiota conissans TaxID=109636 RepID=A0A9P6CND8_9AGAR|nr:hypothetical protein BDN70DRAFT_997645 [Pholiota conissans]
MDAHIISGRNHLHDHFDIPLHCPSNPAFLQVEHRTHIPLRTSKIEDVSLRLQSSSKSPNQKDRIGSMSWSSESSWGTSSSSNSTSSFSEKAGQYMDRSLLVWRACLTIPHALAILSSIYRLYRRTKTRQLWRDDYFAALSLILECLYFPTLWLPEDTRRRALVTTSWIAQVVCPLLIWFTRVSLAFSIARAIPPNQPMRCISICFAWFCGVVGTVVAIGSVITCARKSWDQTYPYQCPMPVASAIIRTCMDILSDVILIIIPFWAFWRRLMSETSEMPCKG